MSQATVEARGGLYPIPLRFWPCDRGLHRQCSGSEELHPIRVDEPRTLRCECLCHPIPKKRGRPPRQE